jgi:osmotically-inducible protein OsmY
VRSDERIREEVCDRLSEGYLDASDIEVSVQGGEVILSGTVSDRRAKRLAAELVDGIVGVRDLENRLKIKGNGEPRTDEPGPS